MDDNKPVSLSVKAWIIRNMSVRTATQERIIETVVNHQFEAAYVAMETCNSIEFSGFGKLFFNKPKALRKIEKYRSQMKEFKKEMDNPETTDLRRRNLQLRMETTMRNFNYLNNKLYGFVEDIRGMEKQAVSPKGTEGADSEGGGAENGNM